jgi:hypothetical protein
MFACLLESSSLKRDSIGFCRSESASADSLQKEKREKERERERERHIKIDNHSFAGQKPALEKELKACKATIQTAFETLVAELNAK